MVHQVRRSGESWGNRVCTEVAARTRTRQITTPHQGAPAMAVARPLTAVTDAGTRFGETAIVSGQLQDSINELERWLTGEADG
ncbi:hypothetical protein BGM19_00565 [Streptomyces agglomeratus]|nr:hypothetical protein BGM19_00565 [Streptomyces agglomeratus]